jgi:hypothetical protein
MTRQSSRPPRASDRHRWRWRDQRLNGGGGRWHILSMRWHHLGTRGLGTSIG